MEEASGEGLRLRVPDGEYHVCKVELATGRVLVVVFPTKLSAAEAEEVSANLGALSGLAKNWAKRE